MKEKTFKKNRKDDNLVRNAVKNALAQAICLAGHRKESFCGYEFELPTLLVMSTGRTGRISTKTFRVFWFDDGVKKKKLCDAELLEVFFLLVDQEMI